jgi:dienelactone hydrolase
LRAAAAGLAAVTVCLALGCGGSGQQSGTLQLRVAPRSALVDAPLRVSVAGAKPRALVTVRVSARDAYGATWSSRATFRADAHGTVDAARSAPVRGSYRGRDGEGLIWSMRPPARSNVAYFVPPYGPTRWTVAVMAPNARAASDEVTRRTASEDVRAIPINRPVVGYYFAPRENAHRAPILLFGGSEGGVSMGLMASLLASRGHPALALGYFGAAGLPETLKRIPLEYFVRAARWIDRQPSVDARRLIVVGASRGSEAALLLASDFPKLVHGVVALSPSSKVNMSLGGRGPAWTLRGKGIPYAQALDADPTYESKAVIPVQRIRGPVLLVAGGQDKTWPSLAYARAIAHRAHHAGLLIYPKAGHYVAIAIPHQPGVPGRDVELTAAEAHARADLWPRLLRFIDDR